MQQLITVEGSEKLSAEVFSCSMAAELTASIVRISVQCYYILLFSHCKPGLSNLIML
jgi:hypothetical protein